MEKEPIQYEGILALIQGNNANTDKLISANHKSSLGFMKSLKAELTEFKADTKHSLEKIDEYNTTQNGRQADMMKRLADVESNCNTKTLTCGVTVENLQRAAEIKVEADKERKGRKLTKRQWIALFIVSTIIGMTAVGGFVISILNYTQ